MFLSQYRTREKLIDHDSKYSQLNPHEFVVDEFKPNESGLTVNDKLIDNIKNTTIIQNLSEAIIELPFLKNIVYDIACVREGGANVFAEHEDVVIMEKLDGIFTGYVWLPENDTINGQRFFGFSKESGKLGLAFPIIKPKNNNIMVRISVDLQIESRIKYMANECTDTEPFFIIGETFGQGIKSREYGCKPTFRLFDIGTALDNQAAYLDYPDMSLMATRHDLPVAPVISVSGYSKAKVAHSTNGQETHSKMFLHAREGVVIRPLVERTSNGFGRVQIKSTPTNLSPGNYMLKAQVIADSVPKTTN